MKIAVLIPCYNEEQTIGKVVGDFRRELPEADVYVYDNNSGDRTSDVARAGGAVVRREWRQGKGNVVRSMFRDVEADVYVMVDGDDTYPADAVHEIIRPVREEEADMVVGDRLSNKSYHQANKRRFHDFGNRLVRGLINSLYGTSLRDILSGYRAFSRRFVKTMPVLAEGFEIESEITLHALDKGFLIREMAVQYRDRPQGSVSKLSTFGDGLAVLRKILWIFKDHKPLQFFSVLSLIFMGAGLACGVVPVWDYLLYRYVYHVPLAILATGVMITSLVLLAVGFILDTVVRCHRRDYELYLNTYGQEDRSRDDA